jgi:hypothetical protein
VFAAIENGKRDGMKEEEKTKLNKREREELSVGGDK